MATRKKKIEKAASAEAAAPAPEGGSSAWSYRDKGGKWSRIEVTTAVARPGNGGWIGVTGRKSGRRLYLPLPIRLIEEVSEIEGGGCVIHAAYGDKIESKETAVEIFALLGTAPLGGASSWSLAG